MAINFWLGSAVVASSKLNSQIFLGVPLQALLIYVYAQGIRGIAKPMELELDEHGLIVTYPLRGETKAIVWKDIAEIKSWTSRSRYGIFLRFKEPDAQAKSSFYIPSGWSGISRGELITKMQDLRERGAG